MADWFAEACRYAYPWGHFPGFLQDVPETIREQITVSRGQHSLTADELVHICGMLMAAGTIPDLYP